MQASYTILNYPGRQLPQQYLNMVLSKWMRSLRYGNDYFKLIDSAAYFTAYSQLIHRTLANANSVVRLAVLTDDFDVVLGFCVYRFDPREHTSRTVDYVHVHKDHRRQGIGRALMPEKVARITHLTRVGMTIWGSKLQNVAFDPFYWRT